MSKATTSHRIVILDMDEVSYNYKMPFSNWCKYIKFLNNIKIDKDEKRK